MIRNGDACIASVMRLDRIAKITCALCSEQGPIQPNPMNGKERIRSYRNGSIGQAYTHSLPNVNETRG